MESGSNFPLLFHGEDGRLTLNKRATLLGQRERRVVRKPMEAEDESVEKRKDDLEGSRAGLGRT